MFDALASRLIGVQMPSGDSNMSKKPKKRTNKKKRGPEIQQKGSFDVASLSNSSRDGIEDPDDTIDDHSEDLFELGNDTSGDVVRSASPKQKGPDPGMAAQLYHFESTQLEDQHQAMIQNVSVESGLSESIVSTTVTRMFETGRRYDDPKSVLKELNRIKAQLLSGEDDDDPTSPAASPARAPKHEYQQGTNPPQRQQHHQQMPARLTEKSGWPPVAAAAAGEEEFASAPGSPRSASPSYDAGTIETKSSPTVSSLPGTEDSGYNRHTTTNGEVDHLSKHAKHALEQLAPRRDATVTGAREGGGRGGGGGDGTRHLTTSRGSKHGIEIESAPSPRTPSSSSGSSSNFPNNANNTQHNQPHQQEQQQPMPQSVSEKLEFVAAYSTTNLYDSLSALCSWACITTSTSTISNGNAVRLERMEKLEQFFNSRALQILFTTLFSDESQPLATKPEVKSALIALLQHLLLFDPTPATAISGTASVHPTASGTSSDYEADEVGATTVVANHLTDALEQLVHQICAIRGTQVVPALLQAPGEGVGGEGMHRSLGSDIMAEKVANCVKTLYFQLYHSMLHIYRARTSGHDTVDSSDGVGGETALSKASDEELFESRLEAIDAQLRELQQGNSSSGSNETTKGKNSTTTVTSVEVAEEGAIAQKLFLSREVCTEKFQLCLENVLKLKNRVEEEQQQQQQSASNNEANGRTSTSSNGGVGSTSSVGRDKRQAELQSDAERTALHTKRKSQLLSFIRDDVEQLEQSLLQACNINPAQPLMAKHQESSSISSSYDRLQWERDSKLGGLDSELNTCQARLEQLKQQKQLLLQQLQACDEEIVSLESRSKTLRDDLGFNTTFYTNKLEELQSSNVNVRKSLQTHNSVNTLMDSVRSFETKVAETLLDACASQEQAAERRQNLQQQQQQQDAGVVVAVAGKQPSGDTSGSGSSTGAKTQKQHDVKMVITASAGGAMHITSVQGNDNTAASSNAASASHPSTSESLVQPQVQDKKGKKGKKEGKSTSSPTAADTTATPDTVVVHKFGDLTLDDLLQRRVHMLQDTVQTYVITETRCIELLCARIHQASEKLTAAKKELLAYAALQMTGSVTTVTEGKIAQLEREILEDQQAVVQLQRGVVHSLHQVNTALNTAPSSSAVSASASASSNSNSATASRTGHGRNPKSKPSAATPPAAVIPPITPPLYEIARIAASCAEAGLVAIPDIVDLAKKYSGPTEVVVRVKSTTATTGTTADAVGNATRAPPAKSTSTSGTSSSTSGHKDNQGSSNTTTTTTTNNTSAGTKRKEQKATATSRVGANTKTASAATTNATTATEKNKKNHGSSTVDPIALLEKSTVQKRGAGDQKVAAVAKANTANPAGGGSGKGGAAAKKTETSSSSSSSSVGATASTSNVWAAKAAATAKPPTPGLLGQDGGHKSLKEIQEEQEEEARKAAEEKKKKKNTIVVPLSEIDNNGESSSSKGTTSKHSEKPKGENSNTNSASVSDSAAGTGSASTMAHTSEPVGDIAIPEVQASPLPKRTRKKKTDPAAAGNEGENEEKATAAGEEKTSTPSSPLVLHHRTHPDKSVHGIPATGSARSSPVGAGGGGGGSGDLGDGKTGTANTPTANDTTEHGGGDGSGGSAGSGAGKEDDSMLLELSMGEESVMTAMSEIRDINPMKKAAPKSDNINTHNSSNSSNSNNNDATATATATTTAEVVAAKEGKEEGGDDDED